MQRSIANTGCANVTCLRLTAKCQGFIQIQSSPAQNVTNVMPATPGRYHCHLFAVLKSYYSAWKGYMNSRE